MQRELDRLSATLRQIEAYNESMQGEIAVTRRAAYAGRCSAGSTSSNVRICAAPAQACGGVLRCLASAAGA